MDRAGERKDERPPSFGNISELNAVLVQDGDLSASDMKEIAGHFCLKIRSAPDRKFATPTIKRPALQDD